MPRTPLAALTLAISATAVLAAPALAQDRRATDLRLSGLGGVPATIQAGEAFALRTTVTNSGTGTARGSRFYVGLTRGSSASPAVRRLATRNLAPLRAGRRITSTLRVRVRPDSRDAYRVVVCATQSGRRVRCVLGPQLAVTKIPPVVPTPAPTPTPLPLDRQLRDAITPAQLTEHTDALADIAVRNGGNRAAGTQGYDDSAAYVLDRLSKAGYSPRIDRFSFILFTENAPPTLTTSVLAAPAAEDFGTTGYSGSGDTGAGKAIVSIDLGPTPTPDSAPPSSNTSGCEAADFAGFPRGAIALMKRGTCTFATKAQNAVDAGASGVLIFNEGQPGREDVLNGTLGAPVKGGANVPVVGTTAAIGEGLAAAANPTGRIVTDTTNEPGSSYNILADTPTGDPGKTVVVGSHLDSVAEGAGINDNGSGSAFTLELAEQMAALKVKPANRVRFAWWGAEEAGLIGATEYVLGLSDAEFGQIGLNLNFDMIGSPNFARLIYDGDFSDSPPPAGASLAPGSADVERAFKAHFDGLQLGTLPTGFDGRSDYKPFQDNGVPTGGLFSGAEEIKSAEGAALFGGTAGVAYDPNYHQAGDAKGNLNLTGFEQMADAAAQVSYQYATAATLPAKFTPVAKRSTGSAALVRKGSAASGEWRGKQRQR